MTDIVEDLIGEVARKHGIALGRDDPILVLHTMNDRLVRESAAAQQVLLDAFKQELEALASRWSMEATNRADRILQAARAGSQEAMDICHAGRGRCNGSLRQDRGRARAGPN